MKREPLTERESKVYEFIVASLREKGFAPSVRDIVNAVGISSTSTAHAVIASLEEKGYIYKENGKSRTLRAADDIEAKATTAVKLPVIGQIAAGQPVLASEVYDESDTIEISVGGKYSASDLFALRVHGESMINIGIFEGDIIVVLRTPHADNGDIVVAMVDDSATVKRFYREDGRFRLQPENDTMEPIYSDEVAILGRVIASVRYY